MKKIFILCLIFSAIHFAGVSQNSSIYGTITEKDTNETIPSANILLEKDSVKIAQTISNIDGYYAFYDLKAGIYSLKVSCMGCKTITMDNIKLEVGKDKKLNFQMIEKFITHGDPDPINTRPIIDIYKMETETTLKAEQIMRIPTER